MKHIAKDANNNLLYVVYMQIPDTTDYALVIDYESIQPQGLKTELANIVGSHESQTSRDLADYLSRKQYADTTESILNFLHKTKQLKKVPIDAVRMNPMGHLLVPLREILAEMGRLGSSIAAPSESFNRFTHNLQATSNEDRSTIARSLLIEAQMYYDTAEAKRAEAYAIAPELNPEVQKAAIAEAAANIAAASEKSETDNPETDKPNEG